MENPNDVKELIPEFFYLPEFLVNSDGNWRSQSYEDLVLYGFNSLLVVQLVSYLPSVQRLSAINWIITESVIILTFTQVLCL